MIIKIKILLLILFSSLIFSNISYWDWVIKMPSETKEIKEASIEFTPPSNDVIENVNHLGFSLLNTIKIVLEWILIIYMVYAGIQMIMAMGSNDEMLTDSKRQIWYTLVALLFINIPQTLYYAFYNDNQKTIWNTSTTAFIDDWWDSNLFVNMFTFRDTLQDKVIWFIEVLIFAIAVFMAILAGIRIMTARWNDEWISEGKSKLIYSIIAIVLVWFIETWRYVAFEWSIDDWVSFFAKLANLALFFAWPIAILFLSFDGYYFITANWDEERIKKAKNIVINTMLATLIILASYAFLLDLATL